MSPKVGDFKGVCGDPRNGLLAVACKLSFLPPSTCNHQVRKFDATSRSHPLGRALAPWGRGVLSLSG